MKYRGVAKFPWGTQRDSRCPIITGTKETWGAAERRRCRFVKTAGIWRAFCSSGRYPNALQPICRIRGYHKSLRTRGKMTNNGMVYPSHLFPLHIHPMPNHWMHFSVCSEGAGRCLGVEMKQGRERRQQRDHLFTAYPQGLS